MKYEPPPDTTPFVAIALIDIAVVIVCHSGNNAVVTISDFASPRSRAAPWWVVV